VPDHPVADFHYLRAGHRKIHYLSQSRCQQFIRQHPQMLRVIAKLHDVEITVGAAHQVPLRSTPHPPHVLDRFHHLKSIPKT
jgi:hypothetical protein